MNRSKMQTHQAKSVSKDEVVFDGATTVVDSFMPEQEVTNFLKQEKPTEWEIDVDVDAKGCPIPLDKRQQAMEYLRDGYGTRKVSRFLGILVHHIYKKQ